MAKVQRAQNTAACIILDTKASMPCQAVALSFALAARSLPHQLQNSLFNLKGSGT